MRFESYIPAAAAKRRGEKLRGGFTLTEVLIAIIVMGIGLTMAAALFPAAMKETETSINDVNGTIIAANGMDIAAGVLAADSTDFPAPDTWYVFADAGHTTIIPAGLQQYSGEPNRGFVVLGRQLAAGRNEYQLVSVAYWKNAGGDVTAEELSGFAVDPNDATGLTVTHAGGGLRVGSPVIAPNGKFAVILSINDDGTEGYLDRRLDSSDNTAWVIHEAGMNTKSPAIATLVRTVMLKQ